MKAAKFDYVAPRDVASAIAALAQGGEDAKLMAGAQSLGPMLNLRLARPKLVVDVSRIDELRTCTDHGDSIRIGAAVTHAAIEDDRAGVPTPSMLRLVARGIAYRAVRNRGTIGGSLAHADPAADWPLALDALDATVIVRGLKGERRIAARGLMIGAYTTTIAADELIVAIDVPKLSPSARWGYHKYCRKTGEFPEASAAILLDPARRVARMSIGALSGAPRVVDDLAARLARDGSIDASAIAAVMARVTPALSSVKARLYAGVVKRAIAAAMQ